MAVLTLKNVKKVYHIGEITIPAVENVSFELNEGEFVVILGASGAGKRKSDRKYLRGCGNGESLYGHI